MLQPLSQIGYFDGRVCYNNGMFGKGLNASSDGHW